MHLREVVVVELSRIRPPQPVRMFQAHGWAERKLTPWTEPFTSPSTVSTPVVKMVIKGPMDKRLFTAQEIPKIQCDGTRASWAAIEQLKPYGGFTLRTPVLDLNKDEHRDAIIEFTVRPLIAFSWRFLRHHTPFGLHTQLCQMPY